MSSTDPAALGQVRILRDAAGTRTTFDELEIGKDLGSLVWTPTQSQVDQVCERMEDHHPYYEVESPFGGTVVPTHMTYLMIRGLFSQTYSVRGLFYKWGLELLEPIRTGVTYRVDAKLTEKWIRNDREFVAYEGTCTDPRGAVVFRTRRAHVLDFIKRTAPKVGEGAIGTSDARTQAAREARAQVWDAHWPADDTAAGTGRIELAPLARPDTPVGAQLPPNSIYFSRAKFLKRQNMYFAGANPTLHVSDEAARQEGLPAPVASAPDIMAMCHQCALDFFGAGWLRGGKADLTASRPTYMHEYLTASGVVTSREELPGGAVRLHCEMSVQNQKGEKKVVGKLSGMVPAAAR